jgi:hypothetical protein
MARHALQQQRLTSELWQGNIAFTSACMAGRSLTQIELVSSQQKLPSPQRKMVKHPITIAIFRKNECI